MFSILILAFALAYSGFYNTEPGSEKPKIWLESTESWLNLMPVVDQEGRNVLCFNIIVKFTGSNLDTNYEITDFNILLNNDDLKNMKISRQVSEISDSGFVLNIYHAPGEIYLDKNKEYPEEVSFTFNIMRESKLIRSVKTYSTTISKTY